MEVIKKKRAPRTKAEPAKPVELTIVSEHLPEKNWKNHEFVAVGIIRHEDATYSQVTVKVKGDRIVSMDVDTPNMKQIAIDALKIACMRKVIDAITF